MARINGDNANSRINFKLMRLIHWKEQIADGITDSMVKHILFQEQHCVLQQIKIPN